MSGNCFYTIFYFYFPSQNVLQAKHWDIISPHLFCLSPPWWLFSGSVLNLRKCINVNAIPVINYHCSIWRSSWSAHTACHVNSRFHPLLNNILQLCYLVLLVPSFCIRFLLACKTLDQRETIATAGDSFSSVQSRRIQWTGGFPEQRAPAFLPGPRESPDRCNSLGRIAEPRRMIWVDSRSRRFWRDLTCLEKYIIFGYNCHLKFRCKYNIFRGSLPTSWGCLATNIKYNSVYLTYNTIYSAAHEDEKKHLIHGSCQQQIMTN